MPSAISSFKNLPQCFHSPRSPTIANFTSINRMSTSRRQMFHRLVADVRFTLSCVGEPGDAMPSPTQQPELNATEIETIHHGMRNTGPSSLVPGFPQTTSALGVTSVPNLIMMLNNVELLDSFGRAGSSRQQIACGELDESANTLLLRTEGVISFPLSSSSFVSSSQRAKRTGLPLNQGGSSTRWFSRKWLVWHTIPRSLG